MFCEYVRCVDKRGFFCEDKKIYNVKIIKKNKLIVIIDFVERFDVVLDKNIY